LLLTLHTSITAMPHTTAPGGSGY